MSMRSNVAIVKTDQYKYPGGGLFRPSKSYPEYLFDEVECLENEAYDMVRQGLHLMGLDDEHYGGVEWNPLKEIVKPGDFVVIKPNLVMDVNRQGGGTECLYTHPSVVAPVIDYVLIALQGNGEIVVGDAPMQGCDFQRLIRDSGYKNMIDFYRNKTSVKITLADFRDLHSVKVNGILRYEMNEASSGIKIDLGRESEFANEDEYFYKNMRITGYDPAILKTHHTESRHEYLINKNIINADVIINMPKPKTHRKAGVTISLKNAVGINSRKEYLPHHTNGSKEEGGDEYMHRSALKRISDKLTDRQNMYAQTMRRYRTAKIFSALRGVIDHVDRLIQKDDYREGSWYGNDTISRTIVDLNRILLYADKSGILREERQRKYLIVADMIISGEKEGPVYPSPKEVGMIVLGTNPVCFDEAIATIMGAKLDFIHTLKRARGSLSPYKLVGEDEHPWLLSNDIRWNEKGIDDLRGDSICFFEPSSGWTEAFYLKQTDDRK